MTMLFDREKETKGTFRYQERAEIETPDGVIPVLAAIRTLYLRKDMIEVWTGSHEPPDTLIITMRPWRGESLAELFLYSEQHAP